MLNKLIILINLIPFSHVFAADMLIKAGINNSWFASEGGKSEAKPAVGIGVQFPLDESNRIKLGIDAVYVGQKMILKDKSWQANSPSVDECGTTFGDLYLHYHYLKIPVFLNSIVYQTEKLAANISVGISFNLTLASSSHGGNRRFEQDYCDYDYQRVSSDTHPGYPTEFVIGTGFFNKTIGLTLCYSYTLGKTDFLYGLKIQDNIHSFRIMLSSKIL